MPLQRYHISKGLRQSASGMMVNHGVMAVGGRRLRLWLALLAAVVLLHVAWTTRVLSGPKPAPRVVTFDARGSLRRHHPSPVGLPSHEPVNEALERAWERVIQNGAETIAASSSASKATALLVHYTAKQRATEMEGNWTAVNGAQIIIRFYNDAASLQLVAQHRPHFLQTYKTKLTPVERADYFRYLVLWIYGGLYVDSDTKFMLPVDEWLGAFDWDPRGDGWKLLASLSLVVGVEFPKPQVQYDETGWLPLQLSQFVIGGAQGSDVLERIIDHIERCARTVDRKGVVERTLQRTGPAAFTRAVLDVISERAEVTESLRKLHEISNSSDERYPHALLPTRELERKGQLIVLDPTTNSSREHILVLPYRAFAFFPSHGIASHAVLTQHLFLNSWRYHA